jgi:hypothetical protein
VKAVRALFFAYLAIIIIGIAYVTALGLMGR